MGGFIWVCRAVYRAVYRAVAVCVYVSKKSNQTVYDVIPLNLLKIYCEFKSDLPTTKPICLIKESQNVLKRQHSTTTNTIRILKATL